MNRTVDILSAYLEDFLARVWLCICYLNISFELLSPHLVSCKDQYNHSLLKMRKNESLSSKNEK